MDVLIGLHFILLTSIEFKNGFHGLFVNQVASII